MSRDEFGHLEHADLALAIEYRPQSIVRINHGPFLFVLQTILLDVIPEFFGELRTREWFRTDNGGKFIVRLYRSHERGIRLALGRSFCFGHRG